MAIQYKEVVPWGRNFNEYRKMFCLSKRDLSLKILGCGDGPSSFNGECTQKGGSVISIDPVYAFTREELQRRIEETRGEVLRQTEKNKDKFLWTKIKSVENLSRIRMKAMTLFLKDYEKGKTEKRYLTASLPELPFQENEFDLALSSHFLFLYSANLSCTFHIRALKEMLRVAKEVRIFPLVDVNSDKSPYLPQVFEEFRSSHPRIQKVDYEFQTGGNEMLVLKKSL